MKIGIFSIDHLRDWHGTTRLLDRIAIAMIARGHSIVIIAHEGRATAKTPVSPLDYPHELVTVNLQGTREREESAKKITASNIEICLASVGNNLIMHLPGLLKGTGIPLVYGDPHDPRVRTFASWQPYESYGALACCDAIQTLLPEYIPYYPAPLRERVTEIGIPAPPPAEVDFNARRAKPERTIIAVGRLNETMKRFSLLLQAFALLRPEFPQWRLKITGDGPYWGYYQEMAQQLGISKFVEFTGAVQNPGQHYALADIFCSSSLIEGFPLVLNEAASYALPLVGQKACVPSEALIKADMGALAETPSEGATPQALADALKPLMAMTDDEREKIGRRACEAVQERYNGKALFDKWETLLCETLDKTRETNETAIMRIMRMQNIDTKAQNGANKDNATEETEGTLRYIGTDWDGLGPDSTVWTGDILDAAGAEIAGRDDPFVPPEKSTANAEAENVRLRCEIARLKEDNKRLEKKYNALLATGMRVTKGTVPLSQKPHKKKKR